MTTKKQHLENLRAEFYDIGIVDRTKHGYELTDDDGKGRRFNSLKEMRKYAAGARKDRDDWQKKSIAEWRDVLLQCQAVLRDIKKDCTLAKYANPSSEYERGIKSFAEYILSEHF